MNAINDYIECALWSSTDDACNPLDKNYGPDDIAPETRARMERDWYLFCLRADGLIVDANLMRGQCSAETQAAHDFWLTRNGHGAGFWDGDWEKSAGEKLTALAKKFGGMDLYVGDDGKIHC